MGADLYIESIRGDEGYFRDSYNGYGLQEVLGFGWWADVAPLLNESTFEHTAYEGFLAGENLIKVRTIMAESGMEIPSAEVLKERGVHDAGVLNDPGSFFTRKRDQLVAFLDRAIEMGEPVLCSL